MRNSNRQLDRMMERIDNGNKIIKVVSIVTQLYFDVISDAQPTEMLCYA